MKSLRVLVLVHEGLVPPDSIEGLTDEEMGPWKAEYDVSVVLRELGHQVEVLGVGDELKPIREAIERFRPHVAFNLLLHFWGVGIYDAHVVSYLELLRTPVTGVNPRGLLLSHDKALSKKLLAFHRIRVPKFLTFRQGGSRRVPRSTRYPLIVKSQNEHASLGIAQASIVRDEAALLERVDFVHRNVGPDAIAEEYIEGRELTVGVLGNQRLTAFPVWELSFENLPDRAAPIATSRVKWDHAYQKKVGLVSKAATDLEPAEAQRIQALAKRIYRVLGLSGYARIDLRRTEAGEIYVLEANPNPDLCFGEDFAEGAEAVGLGYPDLLQRILNLARAWPTPWKS